MITSSVRKLQVSIKYQCKYCYWNIVFDPKVENFIVTDVKRDWDIIVGLYVYVSYWMHLNSHLIDKTVDYRMLTVGAKYFLSDPWNIISFVFLWDFVSYMNKSCIYLPVSQQYKLFVVFMWS